MATLGELAVNLIARTQKFEKGMKRSRRHLKGFKQEATLTQKALMGFGTALAAVGGGAAIIGFINNQRAMIDELAKTSRRLGISTEALGAYQHAASLSGLSTSELHTALERMRDTIGAAVLGERGAIRAFEQLGLSAEQISQAADPLAEIQTALSKIGNQNTKLAIVRDIFGRAGAKALNLFENNLAEVRKEFEAFGGAVTGEEAARIEKFNDALTKITAKFSASGRELLIDVTPVAIRIVERLEKLLDISRRNRERLSGLFGSIQSAGGTAAGAVGLDQSFGRELVRHLQNAFGRGALNATVGPQFTNEALDLLTGDRQIF